MLPIFYRVCTQPIWPLAGELSDQDLAKLRDDLRATDTTLLDATSVSELVYRPGVWSSRVRSQLLGDVSSPWPWCFVAWPVPPDLQQESLEFLDDGYDALAMLVNSEPLDGMEQRLRAEGQLSEEGLTSGLYQDWLSRATARGGTHVVRMQGFATLLQHPEVVGSFPQLTYLADARGQVASILEPDDPSRAPEPEMELAVCELFLNFWQWVCGLANDPAVTKRWQTVPDTVACGHKFVATPPDSMQELTLDMQSFSQRVATYMARN